jgi:hypothetical protein
MRFLGAVAGSALIAVELAATPGAMAADTSASARPDHAVTDFSSARRHKRRAPAEAVPHYRHGSGTIACTRAGCNPVPPGCHAVRDRLVDGSPSGFQIIVC